MLKWLIGVAVLLGAAMIVFYHTTSTGILLRYLNAHPHSALAPAVPLYAGEFYFMFSQSDIADPYYTWVREHFADTEAGQRAYYDQLVEAQYVEHLKSTDCEVFLQKYPSGPYSGAVEQLKLLMQRRESSVGAG